ncbi:hypothetical protein HYPSUDRAFT_102574, partial [Hypholoma sublateritium FD-334 SS-4]
EKAHVLSHAFVRRALETHLGGLQSEISHLYYAQMRLHKATNDSEALVEKNGAHPEVTPKVQDPPAPWLTA